jgi:hypothetical protein
MKQTLAIAVVVWVVVLGLSSQALAVDLWVSEDEISDWTFQGYIKSQTMGMKFPDGALYTYDRAGQDGLKLRAATALSLDDVLVGMEWELSWSTMTEGLSRDGSLMGFGATSAKPRLWDLDTLSQDGTILQADLDRLMVKFPLGPMDITLGRQAISWGSAWFWKPTDRFSPFSPTDIDVDVKRGVDAARAEIFLGQFTSLDLIATFERHEEDDQELWVHGGARLKTTLGRYDFALSLARFQHTSDQDFMAGFEFSGSLGDVGFRGEAALTNSEDAEDLELEAVVGWDYRFSFGLTLAGELFYNGYGTDNPEKYLGYYAYQMAPGSQLASSKGERLARGEAFNIGRYYVGITGSYEAHPLLSVTLSGITNVLDPSSLLIGGLRWSIYQNIRITAGVMVPVGEKSEGVEMKSEFGVAPILGYSVVKISF